MIVLEQTTREKRRGGVLPLHKWQDKIPLSQQIVLDSHKTSLMLHENDCQADDVREL